MYDKNKIHYLAIRPNLYLKTRLKQTLGILPLDIPLPIRIKKLAHHNLYGPIILVPASSRCVQLTLPATGATTRCLFIKRLLSTLAILRNKLERLSLEKNSVKASHEVIN